MVKNRRFQPPNTQSGAFLLDGNGKEVDLVKEILINQELMLVDVVRSIPEINPNTSSGNNEFRDYVKGRKEAITKYLSIINGDVDE